MNTSRLNFSEGIRACPGVITVVASRKRALQPSRDATGPDGSGGLCPAEVVAALRDFAIIARSGVL